MKKNIIIITSIIIYVVILSIIAYYQGEKLIQNSKNKNINIHQIQKTNVFTKLFYYHSKE
jgi:uncharacterized protein YpmB